MPRFSKSRNGIKRRLQYKRRVRARFQRRRTSVRAVAKKVYKLSKFIESKVQKWQYTSGNTVDLPIALNTDGAATLITNPTGFVPMWDAVAPAAAVHDKLGVTRLRMRVRIRNNTEGANCNNWLFLVRLKDAMVTHYNATTGAITMVPNQHYSMGAGVSGFYVHLNPKYFTILKKKFAGTGNYNMGAVQPSTGTQFVLDRTWTWTVPRPFVRRVIWNESGGSWGTLQCSRDPSTNIYLLTFTDNSRADGEWPQVDIGNLWNCYKCD